MRQRKKKTSKSQREKIKILLPFKETVLAALETKPEPKKKRKPKRA